MQICSVCRILSQNMIILVTFQYSPRSGLIFSRSTFTFTFWGLGFILLPRDEEHQLTKWCQEIEPTGVTNM